MKTISKIGIICIVIGATLLGIFGRLGYFDPPAQHDIQLDESLKDAAGIPIGVAVDTYRLQNDNVYHSLILQAYWIGYIIWTLALVFVLMDMSTPGANSNRVEKSVD